MRTRAESPSGYDAFALQIRAVGLRDQLEVMA
jgi:hypothetical protein